MFPPTLCMRPFGVRRSYFWIFLVAPETEEWFSWFSINQEVSPPLNQDFFDAAPGSKRRSPRHRPQSSGAAQHSGLPGIGDFPSVHFVSLSEISIATKRPNSCKVQISWPGLVHQQNSDLLVYITLVQKYNPRFPSDHPQPASIDLWYALVESSPGHPHPIVLLIVSWSWVNKWP